MGIYERKGFDLVSRVLQLHKSDGIKKILDAKVNYHGSTKDLKIQMDRSLLYRIIIVFFKYKVDDVKYVVFIR